MFQKTGYRISPYHIITYRTSAVIPASACLLLKQNGVQSLRDETKYLFDACCAALLHIKLNFCSRCSVYLSFNTKIQSYYYVLRL